VAILTTGVIEDLMKHGIITPGTRTAIAQSNLAVAIGSGARKTDISTAAAMKQRLLSAKSITYSNTYSKDGGGVAAIQRMIESLGITADLEPKIVPQSEAGRAAESVARGENELAFAPLTEIVAVRGAQVLGLFPAEFQSPLAISSGISAKTADAQGAGALVNFLMTPASMKVIKASGMVPIPKP
jgi:molybdate transport system substrate-binding protein